MSISDTRCTITPLHAVTVQIRKTASVLEGGPADFAGLSGPRLRFRGSVHRAISNIRLRWTLRYIPPTIKSDGRSRFPADEVGTERQYRVRELSKRVHREFWSKRQVLLAGALLGERIEEFPDGNVMATLNGRKMRREITVARCAI